MALCLHVDVCLNARSTNAAMGAPKGRHIALVDIDIWEGSVQSRLYGTTHEQWERGLEFVTESIQGSSVCLRQR